MNNALRRAWAKVARKSLTHVKSLQVMDACRLGYPDAAFDAVTAQFLITLVPDPEGALTEMARVLRPGGEIVLVNHFGQAAGPLARIEEVLAPFCARIGWSSDFKAERIQRWAGSQRLTSLDPEPVFPGGFFKVLRLKKPA